MVERVQMAGDAWRDAHDFTAGPSYSTLIAFHAGLCGTTEPRGIFASARRHTAKLVEPSGLSGLIFFFAATPRGDFPK